MSRWYRAYEGTISDAKLAEAASIAGCSRSVAIASWHAILENAAALNDGGRIDIPSRRIAAVLVEPFEVVETLFAAFEAIGLIVDSRVTAWKRRQYESDSSTERSRKHRQTKRNGYATLQKQHATPPETETETETEKKDKGALTRAGKQEPATKTPWEELATVLDAERAEAVIDHRKRLRKPLTPRAARLLAGKFAECPDPNAGADAMIANGWQGFEPSWLQNRNGHRANGPPGRRNFADAVADRLREKDDEQASTCSDRGDVELLPPGTGKSGFADPNL